MAISILQKRKGLARRLILAAMLLGGFFFFSKSAEAACFSTDMGYNVCTNDPGAPDVSGNSVTFYYTTEIGMDNSSYGRVEISPVANFSSGVQSLCRLSNIQGNKTDQSGNCSGAPNVTCYWRFSIFYDDSDYVYSAGADGAGVFSVGPVGAGNNWAWDGSEASSDGTVNGNETGLGWMSMDSVNVGGGASYKVNIPAGDGALSGYAWSENLGWIDFAPAGPYPTTGCNPACPTTGAIRTGNNLSGWARILSIKTEYEKLPSNSGGWQGWIKLSGIAQDGSTYGVDVTRMDGTGINPTYASSDELGWIDFSKALGVASPSLTPQLIICPFSGSTNIPQGETRNLTARYWADYAGVPDCSAVGYADVTALANWTTTDSAVASLSFASPNEVVSAVSTGSATVSAVYAGLTANLAVSVIAPVCTYNLCDASTGYACSVQAGFGPCPVSNCSDTTTPETCVPPANSGSWKEVAP